MLLLPASSAKHCH